jgi:hypothetical protein
MGILSSVEKLLDGKKTYLVAAAAIIAAVLLATGKITEAQFNHFIMVAIPAAIAALRSAIGTK